MKTILLMLAIALLCGCATSQSVVKLEGKGLKRTFPAPYAAVWKSALNAARHGEMRVENSDEARGLIQAKTGARMESWGERVTVWVRKVDDNKTEVEVVSRLVGPHGFWKYQWERPILNDIAIDFGLPLIPEPALVPVRSPKEK